MIGFQRLFAPQKIAIGEKKVVNIQLIRLDEIIRRLLAGAKRSADNLKIADLLNRLTVDASHKRLHATTYHANSNTFFLCHID